jgi:preprotein translocase subunit YajC
MYFTQKVFYGVFELPLLRNAQKRHKKKLKKLKKVGTYLPHFIICQVYVAFNFIFLRRPSSKTRPKNLKKSPKKGRQVGTSGGVSFGAPCAACRCR